MNDEILPTADEVQLIHKYATADVRATAFALRASATVRPRYVLQQIEGRQIARKKIPEWAENEDIVFPPHLSLEQCSSAVAARYKATLANGESLLDLTGGMGVDFWQMAKRHQRATYVEVKPELAALACHNMPLLGLGEAEIICCDALQYIYRCCNAVATPLQHYSTLFVDPARRDEHGRKTVRLSDCTPDIGVLHGDLLQMADVVIAKLSPMLDIADALHQLPSCEELHVVAVGGECKELLMVLRHNPKPLTITAVNIVGEKTDRFCFTPSEEREAQCTYADEPLAYLYEPNAALMKAGAYRSVALHFGLMKLHPNSHLYTSDKLVEDFPGRTFRVKGFCPMGKKNVARLLAGVKKANVAVRNFPLPAPELQRKLGLADGGDVYIFGTTNRKGEVMLVACG